MKSFLLFCCMLCTLVCFAQTAKHLTVSLEKQSVQASLDEDNSTKLLSVYSNTRTAGLLKINNGKWEEEKDLKRSFEIFDSTDKSLVKIPASNQFSYQLNVKQLRSSLKRGSTYSLYTMAVPKDPTRAAAVRVRRILVCRITVK